MPEPSWRRSLAPIRFAPQATPEAGAPPTAPAATPPPPSTGGLRARQRVAAALLALALVAGIAIGRSTATWTPTTPSLSALLQPIAAPTSDATTSAAAQPTAAAPSATSAGRASGSQAASGATGAAAARSSGGAQAGGQGATAGQKAASPEEAAVQQVIQRANEEQVQAIAAHDSSVMQDTSTSDHYQELVQINQDLLDHGVTSINLVKLEWGPIAVNGTTATATTYETWSTTYSDGSTEQSRDRNDYTLIQENGAWKIQSDDHPDQTAPGGSPSGSAVPQPPAISIPNPLAGIGRDTSRNWSGYAAVGSGYTGVSGTWTVPQPTANGSVGADAVWVGIGGVRSRDLIQAGTEEEVTPSGAFRDSAWIETLPQVSRTVPLVVHPGDSVSVSISQSGPDTWDVSFTNNTSGQTYQQTVTYHSSLSSAEWVIEAPSGRGGIAPLDNFGRVQITSAAAIKDGASVSLADAGAQPITMINGAGQPLAVPSTLGGDGASFTVDRTANAESAGPGDWPFPGGRRRGGNRN